MLTNPGLDPVGAGLAAMPEPRAGMPAAPPLPPELLAQIEAVQNGARSFENPDGSVTFDLSEPDDGGMLPEQLPFDANVAEYLPASDLATIANDIIEGVEADLDSVQQMYADYQRGLDLLGLTINRVDDPFEGASGAVHPMLLEAVVRFVANAQAELYPAAGPVRTLIMATGAEPEAEKIAQRKQRWMNYYLTSEDEGYYQDCDAGLVNVALYGSIFRKVYIDPVSGLPRSRYLTPYNLLVSYHAADLASAQRVTQVNQLSRTEFIQRQLSGYYRRTKMVEGGDDEMPNDQATRRLEGRSPSGLKSDAEYIHYHCHCWLDVPGFEHVGEDGQPTGMPLPWIATVDKASNEVLRLERDWVEGASEAVRREHYAHFLFHPGTGFYGWGFIAMVGGSADTATTMLRQAINAFTLSSFPGGVRTKGVRPEESNLSIGPCEFVELDTGGLPIQQAIMTLPYRDVPASFPPLLDAVVSGGQRLGQTVEMQVGEGRQDAPVGTTLALIEQAVRPMAAVLKRLHAAQRKEFRLLAALFATLPDAQYPYIVDGQRGVAMGSDFADSADIVPVSDPNAPTQTQRLAMAQAKLQLAQASGGIMDVRASLEGMLRTLGSDDQEIARLMPPPDQGQPADVVTEFQMALKKKALMAAPTQAHQAHLQAHIAQMQLPNLPPPVVTALLGHCGDHLAWLYRIEASQAVGMPLMPGPMPPQMDAFVAVKVAAATQEIMQAIAPALVGGQPGADPAAMAKIQVEKQKLDFQIADSARKAEETARQDTVEIQKTRLEYESAAADRVEQQKDRQAELAREAMRLMTAQANAAKAGLGRASQPGGRRP